jgi:hypothetical protein
MIDIQISYNEVVVEGHRIPRPSRMSVGQWMDQWEAMVRKQNLFRRSYATY